MKDEAERKTAAHITPAFRGLPWQFDGFGALPPHPERRVQNMQSTEQAPLGLTGKTRAPEKGRLHSPLHPNGLRFPQLFLPCFIEFCNDPLGLLQGQTGGHCSQAGRFSEAALLCPELSCCCVQEGDRLSCCEGRGPKPQQLRRGVCLEPGCCSCRGHSDPLLRLGDPGPKGCSPAESGCQERSSDGAEAGGLLLSKSWAKRSAIRPCSCPADPGCLCPRGKVTPTLLEAGALAEVYLFIYWIYHHLTPPKGDSGLFTIK